MDFDEEKRVNEIQFEHEDQMIATALAMYDIGTGDIKFYQGLLKQVASLGEPGFAISEDATNFALSVVRTIDPRNEVEAMLAVQMAATHMATMTFAKRLHHVKNFVQQDSAEQSLYKLMRTFTTQMETLKRFRSKSFVTKKNHTKRRQKGSRILCETETGSNSSDSTNWNGCQGKILCEFTNGREPLKMRVSTAFQQILFHFVLPRWAASRPLECLRQLSANVLLELCPRQ